MKGTEKQIAYAMDLMRRFIEKTEKDIAVQYKMVAGYRERMAAGETRDYSERCAAREHMITEKTAQVEFVKSLDDAEEIIDMFEFGRVDAHMRAHGLK